MEASELRNGKLACGVGESVLVGACQWIIPLFFSNSFFQTNAKKIFKKMKLLGKKWGKKVKKGEQTKKIVPE